MAHIGERRAGTLDRLFVVDLPRRAFLEFPELRVRELIIHDAAVADQDDTFVEIIRPDDLKEMFESNPMEVDMMLRHMSYRLRRLTVDYKKALNALGSDRQP